MMNESANTIKRRVGDSAFASLREDMLAEVQALSGHVWTDYNIHDPGVTILEQLCYALTDINYRSNYDIETLLSDSEGEIDLHRHGLYTLQEALPCRPVSIVDMQKYLLDRIPDIAYVDVVANTDFIGLWHLRIKPYLGNVNRVCLSEVLVSHFDAIRNLNENICRLEFIDDVDCDLCGSVYIEAHVNPEDVLSRLYILAENFLLGEVARSHFDDHKEDYKKTHNNHDVLLTYMDGPRLTHHYISDLAINSASRPRPVSELISLLVKTPGVLSVEGLRVQPLDTDTSPYIQFLPAINVSSLRLKIPTENAVCQVQVIQNGQRVKIDSESFLHAYENHKNYNESTKQAGRLTPDPHKLIHKKTDIKNYSSVQSQFPSNYGINAFGVPSHSDEKRKGQANQLKGYLLLFDHVMNDHLTMVDNVKTMFSTQTDNITSYPSQYIDASIIANVDDLYINKQSEHAIDLSLDYGIDDKRDRKSRALDYLLALNGRDKALNGFEYKNPYMSSTELQDHIIENKKTAVQCVHDLSENRAGATNYSRKSWNTQNISALEKRLLISLGVESRRRSLVLPLVEAGFSNQHKADTPQAEQGNSTFHFFRNNDNTLKLLVKRFYPTNEPPSDISSELSPDSPSDDAIFSIKHLSRGDAWSSLNANKNKLLHYGCIDAHYRITPSKTEGYVNLVLNISGDKPKWVLLAEFRSVAAAQSAREQLRTGIQQLNLRMEGMHLLEHTLLLPMDDAAMPVLNGLHADDFYNNQVTVLLPNWTSRFSDTDFQQYMEDEIRKECPAHIYVNVHWVDCQIMEKFEVIFKVWCQQKYYKKNIKTLNVLSKYLKTTLEDLQAGTTSPKTSVTNNDGVLNDFT